MSKLQARFTGILISAAITFILIGIYTLFPNVPMSTRFIAMAIVIVLGFLATHKTAFAGNMYGSVLATLAILLAEKYYHLI